MARGHAVRFLRGKLFGFVVALTLALGGATAVAKQGTYTAEDYAEALTPVVESEFAHDGLSGTPDDYACIARRLVLGFTVRRLRDVGAPALVAKERSKQKFDFVRFGVTPDQEKTIMATAMWKCLGVSRMLGLGFEARGLTLSAESRVCLDEKFAADPGAEKGYVEATVREVRRQPRVLTEKLGRAAVILSSCLTVDTKKALSIPS